MNHEKNSNAKEANDTEQIPRNTKLDLVKSIEARPHSSGFKSFLNWFRRVEKLQIEQNAPEEYSDSSSQVSSTSSTATAASFAFLEPQVYKPYGDALQAETFIAPGPYTDTYRRLIDDRERRRKLDKDITLRKKYHLYASGSTLNGTIKSTKEINNIIIPEENATNTAAVYDTFSLPTMSKHNASVVEFRNKGHRRAASETEFARPNSYVHVKGKRKAPLPPDVTERKVSTFRKKRLAPTPPPEKVSIQTETQTSVVTYPVGKSQQRTDENIDEKRKQDEENPTSLPLPSPSTIAENTSPRFWFKRQNSDIKLKIKKSQNENNKAKSKHDFPEIAFFRNSKKHVGKHVKNGHENLKSAGQYLPNISELDREASEIIQMKKQLIEENNNEAQVPVFTNPNSARELISKFNAMNNAKAVIRGGEILGRSSNDSVITNSQDPSISGSNKANAQYTSKLKPVNFGESFPPVNTTWNCHRCLFTNAEKQNKINCFKCKAMREQEKTSIDRETDPTKHLLNSFQEEVFGALSHLGNMSNDKGNSISSKKSFPDNKNEEQQKLRELLKEMKNSLPKRPKSMTSTVNSSLAENVKLTTEELSNAAIDTVATCSNAVPNSVLKFSDTAKPEEKMSSGVHSIMTKLDHNLRKTENSSKIADVKQSQIEKLHHDKPDGKAVSSFHDRNEIKNIHNLNSIYTNIEPKLSGRPQDISSQTKNEGEKDPKILLKQLEEAIVGGNDFVAASIARQLALLKVSCTVSGLAQSGCDEEDFRTIEVYVEDQDSHHGPITLRVRSSVTIGELKGNAHRELDIPIHIQKWIIGKQLAIDDEQRVDVYNNGDFTCPLFLYLVNAEMKGQKNEIRAENMMNHNNDGNMNVEPLMPVIDVAPAKTVHLQSGTEEKPKIIEKAVPKTMAIIEEREATPSSSHYNELINLDSRHLIGNCAAFECPICFGECPPEGGVILRECLHTFCRECLQNTIKFCSEAEVKCPFRDYTYSCESVIQEREIKALVSKEVYEQHLAKSVAVAENSMLKTFHCKTADCKGWCIFEDNVNQFRCPVCTHANCLTCQAIHENLNCKQYQDRLRDNENCENLDGLRTKQMLEEMVSRGDALICPSCQVVLMKKWGCDWVRCSMCKTEICWVTRGPRWGPQGKGDVTAGCQCGVNGLKCHPKCNYCH